MGKESGTEPRPVPSSRDKGQGPQLLWGGSSSWGGAATWAQPSRHPQEGPESETPSCRWELAALPCPPVPHQHHPRSESCALSPKPCHDPFQHRAGVCSPPCQHHPNPGSPQPPVPSTQHPAPSWQSHPCTYSPRVFTSSSCRLVSTVFTPLLCSKTLEHSDFRFPLPQEKTIHPVFCLPRQCQGSARGSPPGLLVGE